MKARHFLLALALAGLAAVGVQAAIPSTGQTGYFYNAATGKFMSHGVPPVSNSGAKVDLYGIPVEIKNEGSVTEFSDATYNYLRLQWCDYYGRYLKVGSTGLTCDGTSYHKWAVRETAEGQFVDAARQKEIVAAAADARLAAVAQKGGLKKILVKQ